MKITSKTRYAIKILTRLSKGSTKIKTGMYISKIESLGLPYTEVVARRLRDTGYINTKKGVNGGYSLAKPINDIYLDDIIRVMETKKYNCGVSELILNKLHIPLNEVDERSKQNVL